MKTLIVTSRLSIVPDGNHGFLREVYEKAGDHIFAVVFINNLTPRNLAVIPALFPLRAPRLGKTLAKNLIELSLDGREKYFRDRHIPVRVISKVNDPEFIQWIKANSIDLIVNVRTEEIYKKALRKAPKLGCINVHHGLLPEERGLMCDLFALAENKPAGFTIHLMTAKIDAGKIFHRQVVSPPGEKNFVEHLKRSAASEGQAVGELMLQIASMNAMPQGTPNTCENPIYRKIKDPIALLKMARKNGVRL